MNPKLIAILKYLIGISVGVLLFYWAFRDTSIENIRSYFKTARWEWLIFSMAFSVLSHFVRALRWRMQLQAAGHKISPASAFAAVMFNYLINLTFPRAGEVARGTIVYQSDKIPVTISIGTVFTERLIDVLMLGILFLTSFYLASPQLLSFWETINAGKTSSSGVLIPGLLVGSIILGGLVWVLREKLLKVSFIKKGYDALINILNSVLSIFKLKNPILFIFYTLVIWGCYWMMMYVGLYCFEPIAELSTSQSLLKFAFIGTVIGSVGMALPIPGGIGPYHNAIIFTFVAFSLFPEESLSRTMGQTFAFAFHSAQMLVQIIGGLIGYLYLVLKKGRVIEKK